MKLGQLQKVDLREIWRHEAGDFTTWLARKENLQLLGEEIGIDISPVETEAAVGRFNVDLLAEEDNTRRKIIIENQLEVTNHDHLGKLITYASGLGADILIWIVKDVRDEHKQAIDWLNEHTDDGINIFIIRMELWRIGDSPCAPKFHVVSQPNDWAKAIKKSVSGSTSLTDRKLMQLDFWSSFKEFAKENKKLRLRKAYPQHWYDISIGSSKAHLSLVVDADNHQVRCEFYIPDSKPLFRALAARQNIIDSAVGHKLEWMELPGRKASRIRAVHEIDVKNRDNWDAAFQWLADTAIRFQDVFSRELKKLEA